MDKGSTGKGEITESKKKQNDKKNKNPVSSKNNLVSSSENSEKNQETLRKKQKRRGRSRRDDRYYGRFHCKNCNRHWESAHVYTIGGTKKVKFRQACKQCKEYHFPYRLQILRCSQCLKVPCSCVCDECGKLKHKRYVIFKKRDAEDESDEEEAEDPAYQYCQCEGDRRKDSQVGANIDPKKNHLSDLCERCQKGIKCIYGRMAKNDDLQ